MEFLLLKTIVLSAIFLGFYYLFLEKEKIFKFNRIYLIGSLVFSYVIPFVTIADPFQSEIKPTLIIGEAVEKLQAGTSPAPAAFDWMQFLIVIYVLISTFFLLQFIYSIIKIKRLKGKEIRRQNQKIVLLESEHAPFSFLNTIYINSKYFINGEIDERILLHEKCHVTEKHTMDILLVELLRILFWFNPTLFFYKKAMVTNHEFLADDYVLRNNYDRSGYQNLILNEIRRLRNFNLTQSFNFNNTKKRFIMMTTKKSQFVWLKKLTLFPLLAVLFLLFAKKVTAQTETKTAAESALQKGKTQNVAVSSEKTKLNAVETKVAETLTDLPIESKAVQDTVKKRNVEQAVAPVPPPPPPPSEFKGILPQFPNGINAFRTVVVKNFNTAVFAGNEGIIRTQLYFTIDENGKMSEAEATGDNATFNKEAERVIGEVAKEYSWTPAMEDGVPVRYRFYMPLTMQFEAASSVQKSNVKK